MEAAGLKRSPLKPGTTTLKATKPMRRVSKRRAAHRASQEGRDGLAYMRAVKMLDCAVCGAQGPCEAHHCRHLPPADDNEGMGPYKRLPGAGMKSSDHDTIPACQACHNIRHFQPAEFWEKHGPDYAYIEATREAVKRLLR